VRLPLVRKELSLLNKIGIIKQITVTREISLKGKTKKHKKKKVLVWRLEPSFVYRAALENLLINMIPLSSKRLVNRFDKVGRMKLIIVAGVFIQEWDHSRVDVLLVGDRIKASVAERAVRALEADIGRELRFALFETQDFLYRLGVCDRLIRDILEYPHERILDKLGVDEPKDVIV